MARDGEDRDQNGPRAIIGIRDGADGEDGQHRADQSPGHHRGEGHLHPGVLGAPPSRATNCHGHRRNCVEDIRHLPAPGERRLPSTRRFPVPLSRRRRMPIPPSPQPQIIIASARAAAVARP